MTEAVVSAWRIPALSRSTIAGGVFAGAKNIPQVLDGGMVGTDSLTSGTFGNSGNGLRALKPIARMFPSWTSGNADAGVANVAWMLPCISAVNTSDAPRYGTCSI